MLKLRIDARAGARHDLASSSDNGWRMAAHDSSSTRAVGLWSAILTTLFSLAYIVAQLAEWRGALGSAGGPESSSTARGLMWLLTPSLLLGPAFVALMVSVAQRAPAARRVWGHLSVAFATMYATLTGLVYYVQLTLVAPRLAQNRMQDIELLRFVPFDSFLYAVDVFGYSLMCLSMLVAAPTFANGEPERWVRFALIANGLLLPFLALQMYFPSLIWGGALWAITFPIATVALALAFYRAPRAVDVKRFAA